MGDYGNPNEVWTTRYKAIGVLACIGGLIVHLVIGSLYQWGIINIYVTSYFKTIDSSVTLESNAIAFPLMQFSYGLTMRLGIAFSEATHPVFALVVTCFCYSGVVFASSFVTNMWAFLILYGIGFGLLVGIVFMIPVVECNKYFPGYKMYVNGCILAGTGLGSIVFSNFSYNYLNPHKIKPIDGYYIGTVELEELALLVPSLIRYLSLFYLTMGLGSTAMMAPVMIHNRRKENEKLAEIQAKKQENERKGIPNVDQGPQIIPNEANSIAQALSTRVCWVQVFLVIVMATGMYLLNGNYKTYVKKTIDDDSFLTIIGVLGSLMNGTSRILWNILFLKTGYRFVMTLIMAISCIVLATIRFTVHNKGAYLVQILLINTSLGGLLVTTPTVVQTIFGQKTGSNFYGFFWCVIATGNWIQYFYVAYVSKSIGFDNVIYIALGMAVLAFPILIFNNFQGPWMNSLKDLGWLDNWNRKEEINKKFEPELKNDSETLQEINMTPHKQSNENTSALRPPKKLPPINHEEYEITLKSTGRKEDIESSSIMFTDSSPQKLNNSNKKILDSSR